MFKFLSMYLQTQETVTKEASCCPSEWEHYSICVQKFTYMNILIFLFFLMVSLNWFFFFPLWDVVQKPPKPVLMWIGSMFFVFTFQQSSCWFEVTLKNFEVVLLFHYSIHLECTSATGSKWPSMDQTCLHTTFHRCSLGFRSGEFGCQVNFSKSLLCSFLWSSLFYLFYFYFI